MIKCATHLRALEIGKKIAIPKEKLPSRWAGLNSLDLQPRKYRNHVNALQFGFMVASIKQLFQVIWLQLTNAPAPTLRNFPLCAIKVTRSVYTSKYSQHRKHCCTNPPLCLLTQEKCWNLQVLHWFPQPTWLGWIYNTQQYGQELAVLSMQD